MNKQQVSKYGSVIAIALAIVLISNTFVSTFAVSSTTIGVFNQWLGLTVEHHIIFTDGVKFYDKDGDSGKTVSYNGADTAIQAAIDYCPVTVCDIKIREGNYTIITPITISKPNVHIEGIGGGMSDHLGEGTTLKRGTSNAIIKLEPFGGKDLNGFSLTHLALEGSLSDTVNMFDTMSFNGTGVAVNAFTIEDIGVKNLAQGISAFAICNPDNGWRIWNIHTSGGSNAAGNGDTLGKVVDVGGCGRISGNGDIYNIDCGDLKGNNSACVAVQARLLTNSAMNRMDINKIHAFGGDTNTATNAVALLVKSAGFSWDIGDIRSEYTRLATINGYSGSLQDVHFHDFSYSDRRSCCVTSANKIGLDLGTLTRNIRIDGVDEFIGHDSVHVGIAFRNNNSATGQLANFVDNTNFRFMNSSIIEKASIFDVIYSGVLPTFTTPINLVSQCVYNVYVDTAYNAKNTITAKIDYTEATNATKVIQQALDANIGNVCLSKGNFNTDVEVAMTHDNQKLLGAGPDLTILNETRNAKNVIHIYGTTRTQVSGMTLQSADGTADKLKIDQTALTGPGCKACKFSDLKIIGGDSTHYGILAENIYQSGFYDNVIRDGVNGIRIVNNDTLLTNGNNVFVNNHILPIGTTAGTAISITKTATYSNDGNTFTNTEIAPQANATSSIGVSVAASYTVFNSLNIKNVDTGIDVTTGNKNEFIGGHIIANGSSTSAKGALNTQSGAKNTHFEGLELTAQTQNVGNTGIKDAVNTASAGSHYNSIREDRFATRVSITNAAITRFSALTDLFSGKYSENGGLATLSGNNSTLVFTIAHLVWVTPTTFSVTPNSSCAVDNAGTTLKYYVTVDTTNITITYITKPPPTCSSTLLFYWRAAYTP